MMSTLSFLFILLFYSSLTVGYDADTNPFTPKAFAIRYWDKAIKNKLIKPKFLISKVSPLTAIEAAKYAKLAQTNELSTRLPEFCSAANLLCFPDSVKPSLAKHPFGGKFSIYNNGENFTSYGDNGAGPFSSFKNYSDNVFATPVNEFRGYSKSSAGGSEEFVTYANHGIVINGGVIDESFHTYGSNSGGGTGKFTRYGHDSINADLRFTTYSSGAAGREERFSKYSDDGNLGNQSFSNYGKDAAGAVSEFNSYGNNSIASPSSFSNYGEKGAGPNDTFTNYAINEDEALENFKTYGSGTVGGIQSFTTYREGANIGVDSFESYAKDTDQGSEVEFTNYGKTNNGFNYGKIFDDFDTFKGYAKNATGNPKVGFKEYGVNNTFKDYNKDATVSFSSYTNSSKSSSHSHGVSGNHVNRRVEPGKFFRETMLKEGTVMPMPDIKDKMPKRSFLPRSILTKLPFTVSDLKRVFMAPDESSMDRMIKDSLGECERAPSVGETKRCVGSVEDMIDFATSVLGRDITVRSTENVNGAKKNVMVGQVRGINGGNVTKSVSCHQSLFPYLLYYCHSVPKVRVYEADLLDPSSKAKINHGVAICHLDTTAWSATHGAFLALGSGPGKIEVCHWIFENDMTWTIAN